MQKIWKIKERKGTKEKNGEEKFSLELERKYGAVVLRLLANRGIVDEKEIEQFFDFQYDRDVLDPFLFADMEKAVARIILAKEKKEKVAIFGDYDADGVTATVILFEALTDLGFENLSYYIPDRQTEGYGINLGALEKIKNDGVSLIITVDCGITSFEEAEKATELGIDLIISDHHSVIDGQLPKVLALINPHVPNCGYPFADLAGVGVAFKLTQALYQKMNPDKIDQLKWALDLVAIGTIADCVPMLGENRVLTKYGLVVLSKTRRVGLLEMFKVGRVQIDENHCPDTQKVAFQISPRINAAGRMDHANTAFFLLKEKEIPEARVLALEVEARNQERQKMTAEIAREIRLVAQNSFKDKNFIFAWNENWPIGILGLVAGKIAEEFGKPTIVLQKKPDEIAGSLRSIPSVNLVEILEECAELLDKFGGHSQAAGVRMKHEKLEKFYAKFEEALDKRMTGENVILTIEADAEIKSEDIEWNLMNDLKKMEPFGEGNKEPIFWMKNLVVNDARVVGNGSKHLKLSVRSLDGNPKIFDAIGFGMGEKFPEIKPGSQIEVLCNIQEDEWNGNKKIQLNLVDLKMVN